MKNGTKTTPPKAENLKLKEKSEVFSDVTHVSQRSYQFHITPTVKVPLHSFSTSTSTFSKWAPATSPKIITTSTAWTTTTPRTGREKATCSTPKCAISSSRMRSVLMEIAVRAHILSWRNITAITNTRNNFAHTSLTPSRTASMETSALTLTPNKKFSPRSFITIPKTTTSICSITKLSSAPSILLNTINLNASMIIIYRIIGENQISITTAPFLASTGRLRTIYMTIIAGVKMGRCVICATDGKSSSIILPSIRLWSARLQVARKVHVRIIIPRKRRELSSVKS